MTRLAAASARCELLPPVVRAAFWVVLASACVVGFTTIAKHLSAGLPIGVIVLFRCLFGLFFLAPWLWRAGPRGLATRQPVLMAARGINTLIGLYLVIAAVSLIPVADVMAIMFSKPIFASIAAVLVLGEMMTRARWTGTLIGFCGMLIIVQPGFAEVNPGAALALLAMVSGAFTSITVKLLTRTEPPDRIVAYTVGIMMLGALVPAVLDWRTPGWEELGWLFVMGGLANGFQRCLTRAYAAADATVVLPFEFIRLPMAALIGLVVFGTVAGIWTWVGGTVIFAAALWVVRAESRRPAAPAGARPDG